MVVINRMLSEEPHFLDQQSGSLKSDHPSSTGQWATVLGRISFRERSINRELKNIWEKSCYHRIECFTPNQLATLM